MIGNWKLSNIETFFIVPLKSDTSNFRKLIKIILLKVTKTGLFVFFFVFFFYQGFLSWTLTTHRTAGEGRGTFLFSTLPVPPACEHSDIYVQLCTRDDCHTFLIATLVFIRLLLDEIYHRIELLFDWLMWCWFKFVCLLIWF